MNQKQTGISNNTLKPNSHQNLSNKNIQPVQKAEKQKEKSINKTNQGTLLNGKHLLGTIFQTILEIIEDKRDYEIPYSIYAGMIVIYMLQIGGYVFQSDSVPLMKEQKIQTLAYVSEISTGTYFLQLKGNDTETIECFYLMQFIMWFQVLYICFIAFLKLFFSKWFKENRKLFKRPNQILNIYFMVYVWLIVLPYIEVFSGFCNCGQYSYLLAYTDPSTCYLKPKIFLILGYSGLVITILNTLILLFFYRNYEFNDSNILKRRFHPILLIQVTLYFIVIFFYYIPSIPINILYVCLHLVGATYIYDSILIIPYKNLFIAKFYAVSSICYEVLCIIITLWVYDSSFHDSELLYNCMIFSSIFIALFFGIWNYKYEKIMRFASFIGYSEHFHIDMFLEEIFRLAQDYQKSEYSKIKLFEIILFHQASCNQPLCYCKASAFKDEKNMLILEDVYKLIDSIFIYTLSSQQIKKDRDQFEHVSLKYITYLSKYRNNPMRAYYEIKKIQSQQRNVSLYFTTLSKILSQKMEENLINLQNQRMSIYSRYDQVVIQKNQVKLIEKSEKIKGVLLPLLRKYIIQKTSYLEKLRQGYQKIDDLQVEISKLTKFGWQIQKVFSQYFKKSSYSSQIMQSVQMLKLESIYKCTVLNEYVNSLQIEQQIQDLKLKDLSKPQNQIHSVNIINQNIVHFLVSLARDKGKILTNTNQCKKSLCRFLGRPLSDDKKITHIDIFMPNFFQEIHNELMSNMINKGSSKLLEQSYHTFAQNFKSFIFPINLYLDSTYHFQDDFCVNATVLKIDTPNQYILFDPEGKIKGISQDIFRQISDCEEQSQDQAAHLNFANQQNTQQKYSFNLETLKNKILIFFLMPKLAEIVTSHMLNTIQGSEQNFQRFSTELFLQAKTTKKQEQVCYKEKAKIKIPSNLTKIINQFLNYSVNPLEKTRGSTFNKQATMATETPSINIFYEKLKSFLEEKRRDYTFESCKKVLNIKFNLYFDKLHYMKNNKKLEKLYYCMEIVEISQCSDLTDKTNIYSALDYQMSPKNIQNQSRNEISSTDSDVTSYYKCDTLRYNESPKRSFQSRRPSQLNFSSKKVFSQEDNAFNLNSFGSFTIQSPTKQQQISSQFPQVIKTNSEQILNDLKLNHKHDIQFESDFNSLTHKEQEIFSVEYLSPRASERQNFKLTEDHRVQSPRKKSLSKGPIFSSENFLKKIGSQGSIQEQTSNCHTQHSQEEETSKTKQSNFKSLDKNPSDNVKSITLDLNPLTKYLNVKIEKQVSWKNIKHSPKSNQPSIQIINNLASQNSISSPPINANHSKLDKTLKKEQQNNEKNEQILEQHLFGQIQGKSQNGFQNRSKDNQYMFELAHNKKMHYSIHQFFICLACFLCIFYISSVILDISLYYPIQDIIRDFNSGITEASLSSLYSSQTLFSLLIYQIDTGSSYLNNQQTVRQQLQEECDQISKLYSSQLLQLFNDYEKGIYLQQNQTYTYVYSALVLQHEENSSSYTLLFRNLYNILSVCSQDSINKNSFFYLLSNMDLNKNLSNTRIQELQNQLNDKIDDLKRIQILFIIILSSLMFALFVVSGPSIGRYNKYKQQLLLIATRITQLECEKLISILQQYTSLLQEDSDEKWMLADFVGIALKINSQENFKVKAQKKDQQLSSLIVDQNLGKKVESRIVIVAFSTIILFFGIIMTIVFIYNSKMSTSISLYRDSLLMQNEFFNQKTLYEQLISQRIIQSVDSNYPQIPDNNSKLNIINSSQEFLQEYIRDFLNNLDKCSSMDGNDSSHIQNIFTSDLCTQLIDTDYPCDSNDDYLQQGLQSLIQFQIQFIERDYYLMQNDLSLDLQKTKHQVSQSSEIYFHYFIDDYDKVSEIFQLFLKLFKNSLSNQYQNLIYIIQSYLLGVSSFVAVMLLIAGILVGFYQQSMINHLRFSMTFLPYEKSLDESTLFLLKNLSKI
ncbi:transmembrane protein, putative (macronuclear) [Tetrahymena thermophila SB210]|uniref:Transmembrane protein, putative n=1 Tax=Tetrahymena thermophila (strain SB210) TaxID=312017 RepID=Q22Y10_TETTS|nr:transmembrane protein, putative [Tetrahymena thermophila SB210]EAR90214.2 transmembrane protein, putative [Tetrahymena thermophila SB210]|eukprot:XP_001010459.2 transmembrane protein, putative [Tetrahymena thermophila SB210]